MLIEAARSLRTGGENVFYKETDKSQADPARRRQDHGVPGQKQLAAPDASMTEAPEPEVPSKADQKWALPPHPYANGQQLRQLCEEHNLTIAQIVWENERHYLSDDEIRKKLLGIFAIMDQCIAEGVTTNETHLPGSLNLRRRAPKLYKRLMRGFYPNLADSPTDAAGNAIVGVNKMIGRLDHPVPAVPPRKAMFPALEWLSTYAIAVNEVNAAGGRIIVAPTAGACGVIPSVLKYVTEFVSIDAEKDILTFLLTAAAIGMLFKRYGHHEQTEPMIS